MDKKKQIPHQNQPAKPESTVCPRWRVIWVSTQAPREKIIAAMMAFIEQAKAREDHVSSGDKQDCSTQLPDKP